MANLREYQKKRDFKKTSEPRGRIEKNNKKLRFVVQHHLASHDHYDLRLEWDGVLKSFALPKGPSYCACDKRLAIMVEDHPLSYRHFEGIIPKGEYGGGTVMLWDEGYWSLVNEVRKPFGKEEMKIIFMGKRLKGKWTLVPFKENNWLFIKEKDRFENWCRLSLFTRSIKTGYSMNEIAREKTEPKQKDWMVQGIEITSPDKIIFSLGKVSKYELVRYYEKVFPRMFPFLENRLVSTKRCPDGVLDHSFYVKHFDVDVNLGMRHVKLTNDKGEKKDYAYILNIGGLIKEVQLNGYEFHLWGSEVIRLNRPNMMVFDFDPDEGLGLVKLRQGVRDLKAILDELHLKSFLKTSGGKGYHVVVPFTSFRSWKKFEDFAQGVAKLMVHKWPRRYVMSMSKKGRKGKIFIDWMRNKKGATSVAPYSIRLRKKPTVSMPIFWNELDKVKPDEITIDVALNRLKKKDPWADFFYIQQ